MGFGSHWVTSLEWCYSTQHYNEYTNNYCHNIDDDDDQKKIPNWFYLPYCVEIEKYREFTNNVCLNQPTH